MEVSLRSDTHSWSILKKQSLSYTQSIVYFPASYTGYFLIVSTPGQQVSSVPLGTQEIRQTLPPLSFSPGIFPPYHCLQFSNTKATSNK